ncbi:DUF1476 domain-containing protein [Phaeospirillum tilakii]|uniref:DUF1476 domain-containing protein n=1 Tax=Phaeospirillum tilakii TaxID=741673 RepID=A0ABW5CBW2_9PROT
MTTFDEREKGFEAKYRLDQDQLFKIRMRRGRLFGLWAAERMGLTGAAAEAYARSVVEAEIDYPEAEILPRLSCDLANRGVKLSEGELRERMGQCEAQARAELLAELAP